MKVDNSVVIKEVSKTYQLNKGNYVNALDKVSLNIKRGEKWGIIGKNGSGKSTLLSILSSITKPSAGEIVLNGSLSHILDVGSNFIADLTGRENVVQFLKLQGKSKEMIAEKMQDIEDFAGIEDYFDEAIKTYSSGMFLRLAFSTVIQLESDILIVDEVFNAGDALFREKLKRHFKDNMGSNTTVLLASHNPEEISEFCTHCIWLENGVVQEKGKSTEVLKKYYYQLAKEHSFKTNSAQFVKGVKNIATCLQGDENEILTLREFSYQPIKGYDNISYHNGAEFVIKIFKKVKNVSVHPQVIILDYQKKPILSLFAQADSKADKYNKELQDYIGDLTYKVNLPPKTLTYGHFYLQLIFGKDVCLTKEFNEEALKVSELLFFEIKRSIQSEYLGRVENIFVKPECNWNIDLE